MGGWVWLVPWEEWIGPMESSPRERPLLGIALLVTGMQVLTLMDGIAKLLSARYPLLEVVWARYFFHVALLVPWVAWRYRGRALRLAHPGLQLLRGVLMLVATGGFFAAIARIPIADALAIAFVSPLLITALSPWLLGERVGTRRWAAVLVGFAGVLIVLRPGAVPLTTGSLLALATGFAYAFYTITTRRLAGSGAPLLTLTHTALVGCVVTTMLVTTVWVTPTAGDLGLMVMMGLLGAAGHFLVISAYEHGPASLLAPCAYTEIAGAVLVGWFAFGDFPDGWTWVGIAVVAGSGVYITLRERKAPVVSASA